MLFPDAFNVYRYKYNILKQEFVNEQFRINNIYSINSLLIYYLPHYHDDNLKLEIGHHL